MNRNHNPFLVFGLILCIAFISCEKDKNSAEIDYLKFKEIAWNSLSPETQEDVLQDWQDAEAAVGKNPDSFFDDIVVVVFHTPNNILTCAISVYVDIDTETVIYPENILHCL